MGRENFSTNTEWEKRFCYSRAVKINNQIFVSGTTAVDENDNIIGKGNLAEQTDYIFNKIRMTCEKLNSSMKDLVRIRIYVVDINDASIIGEVMAKHLAGINPAATMVEVNKLINKELLIEIEADFLITDN